MGPVWERVMLYVLQPGQKRKIWVYIRRPQDETVGGGQWRADAHTLDRSGGCPAPLGLDWGVGWGSKEILPR